MHCLILRSGAATAYVSTLKEKKTLDISLKNLAPIDSIMTTPGYPNYLRLKGQIQGRCEFALFRIVVLYFYVSAKCKCNTNTNV